MTKDADQLHWSVPCTTPGAGQRTVSVLVVGDRVAVILPPGDTLILDRGEAEDFATMLDNAASRTDATG